MEPIALEDLALLEVLQQISHGTDAPSLDPEVKKRLVASALVEDDDGRVVLTRAGIALCKSLQHRVVADKLAERIIEAREGAAPS
ncbi:hypothetical protein [Luteimonas deserti]|uniref:TIGR02647 family protein n=1 Tax=Luteimonas deserti TaxID=2752306 RepID=A0A7Z0TUK5_9GAMM|nr:hypothetical protein [Luteimonas deserti]NYZ62946.1 hypothetical protein [Luteimonas deserti]